ncbi:MAG: hypothetical protein IT336_02115 [Thermomicrobiales bacterium]|nr:hypothetical protein [Thermomicrobiales bacterium]
MNAQLLHRRTDARRGQILVLFALLFPAAIGALALGLDAAHLLAEKRAMQGAADLSALAGAAFLPESPADAQTQAVSYAGLNDYEDGVDAVAVTTQSPYSGADPDVASTDKIEVRIRHSVSTFFLPLFGIDSVSIEVRAVAYRPPATAGGDYVFFANRDDCAGAQVNPPNALELYGGGDRITGRIHSNGNFRIVGGGFALNSGETGMNTYACKKVAENSYPPPDLTKTPVHDFPIEVSREDFSCTYTVPSGTLNVAKYSQSGNSSGPLKPGVYCSDGDILLPSWIAPSTVTLVAKGRVSITGGGMTLSPFSDGVLIYTESSGNSSNPAVNINGGGIRWSGTVIAPTGHAYLLGGGFTGKIGVYARTIAFMGGGNVLEANVIGGGPRPQARLIA